MRIMRADMVYRLEIMQEAIIWTRHSILMKWVKHHIKGQADGLPLLQ